MNKSPYADCIKECLLKMGLPFDDATCARVEAYMRVAHETLDGLDARDFASEVAIGWNCIVEGGVEMADSVARSFGLDGGPAL